MKKGQKQDMKINFANGEMYHASSTRYDWFYSVYLRNFILRPSCYECPFAQQERYADITLADHWGYNDDKSYSLIVTNTRKGDVFINQCDESVVEIPISEVNQPHMYRPCAKPDRRELFWSIYLERGYLDVQKWIGNNTLKGKVKDNLARMFYSIGLASLIKKLMRIRGAKK